MYHLSKTEERKSRIIDPMESEILLSDFQFVHFCQINSHRHNAVKQSQRSYKSNIMTKTTNDATHTIIDGKPYNWRVQKLSCRVGNEHFHHRVEYL